MDPEDPDLASPSPVRGRTGQGVEPRAPTSCGDAGAAAGVGILGVAVPFGRLTAEQLTSLADAAADGDLRLTPWRAVLVPGGGDRAEALAAAGLIVAAEDPRLAVVACPGAPECESAAHAVRTDALALSHVASRLAGTGVRLHVSGCAKGCARPGSTAVTLVAREGGYDLVRNGRAGDSPVSTGLMRQDIEIILGRLGGDTGTATGE